jgi:hypothetical protein
MQEHATQCQCAAAPGAGAAAAGPLSGDSCDIATPPPLMSRSSRPHSLCCRVVCVPMTGSVSVLLLLL